MPTSNICVQGMLASVSVWASVLLAAVVTAALAGAARADAPPKPVPGKQVHFPQGTWAAVPQLGPNNKVRQCVLLAPRSRLSPTGAMDTALSIIIGRGAGLAFGLRDDELPSDAILDDQAEVIVDGHSFPAVAFTIANAKDIAIHPGDAAGVCWPRSPM